MKKYNKLTEEQLKATYANVYVWSQAKQDLDRLSAEDSDIALELAELLRLKPLCLELSPHALIALFLVTLGCDDEPTKWKNADDPEQAAQDFFDSGEWVRILDASEEAKQQVMFSLVMAIGANLQAVQIYSKSMFELLCELDGGDDEALFRAIIVDRSAMGTPVVQTRIQLATLRGEEEFFDKFAKAIKGTRPVRPTPQMNDMRLMTYVLDDVGALAELTNSEVTRLFVDELQIYDDDGRADPSAAIAKFVQRFKKTRTPKP